MVGNTLADKEKDLTEMREGRDAAVSEIERQGKKITKLQDDISLLEEGHNIGEACPAPHTLYWTYFCAVSARNTSKSFDKCTPIMVSY